MRIRPNFGPKYCFAGSLPRLRTGPLSPAHQLAQAINKVIPSFSTISIILNSQKTTPHTLSITLMALLHTAERYEMIDYVSGEMEYLPTAVAHLHGDITYPFFLDFRFTMLIHFAHSLSGCYFQRIELENYPAHWTHNIVCFDSPQVPLQLAI